MAEPLLAPAAQAVDFDPFAGPAIAHLSALTASQAEIWLAGQLGGADASRAYNESVSLRLQGALNEEALRAALQALGQRHEALRTTVSADGRVLCVLAERPITLACLDFSAEPPEAQEAAVARHAAEHADYVFDLLAGPVWRASLLTLGPGRFHFTLTAHHIICDGWSLGVLLQDLGQLYSAAVRGEAAALPPAVPFRAYADQEALAQD
ncbi:MAG: condensation domain-containing protein, partial [Bacteroidota bacterium]|nr:condensation domain-containing protein [Bacteroidota bacterium]